MAPLTRLLAPTLFLGAQIASLSAASITSNVWDLSSDGYDYVIVGGGLSGLVLANRLSADNTTTVLVLEAGADARYSTFVNDPLNVMDFPYEALSTTRYKSPPGSTPFLLPAGTRVTVLSGDEDWVTCRLEGDGGEGSVPAQFVERIKEDLGLDESAPVLSSAQGVNDTAGAKQASGETTAAERQVEEDRATTTEEDRGTLAPTTSKASTPAVDTSLPDTTDPTSPVSTQNPVIQTPVPTSPPQINKPLVAPSSPPPVAAAKPGSLRERIAALNAAGAGAMGPGSAPPPRGPKPTFARKQLPIPNSSDTTIPPAPSSSNAEAAAAPTLPPLSSSPPSPPRATASIQSAMNPQDAAESIFKGGSLKERIAALQGMKVEGPGAPGRAPKPWKKKEVPVEAVIPPTVAAEGDSSPTDIGEKVDSIDASSNIDGDDTKDEDTVPASAAALPSQPSILDPSSLPSASPEVLQQLPPTVERVAMPITALPKRAGPPRRKVATPSPQSSLSIPPITTTTPALEETTLSSPNTSKNQGKLAAESKELPVIAPSTSAEKLSSLDFPSPPRSPSPLDTIATPASVDEFSTVSKSPVLEQGTFSADHLETPGEAVDTSVPTAISDIGHLDRDATSIGEEDEAVLEDVEQLPPRPAGPVLGHHVSPVVDEKRSYPVVEAAKFRGLEEEADAVAEEHDEEDVEEAIVAPPPLPSGRPPIPKSFEAPPPRALPTAPIAIPIPAVSLSGQDANLDTSLAGTPDVESEEAQADIPPPMPSRAGRPPVPNAPSRGGTASSGFAAKLEALQRAPLPVAASPEEDGEGENSAVSKDDDEEDGEIASPIASKGVTVAEQGERSDDHMQASAEVQEDDEEEEEEEEDPEVVRRAALAKRMAALGGMNMRMGMPAMPVAGMRKPMRKKSEEASDVGTDNGEEDAPSPTARRPRGIPRGGFLMPGMLPPAPQKVLEAEPGEDTEVPATESADETSAFEESAEESEDVQEVAPPVPSNRPPPLPKSSSSLPPLRSLPTPKASEESSAALPPLPAGRPVPPPLDTTHFVNEPFELHDLDQEESRSPNSRIASPTISKLPSSPLSPSRRPPVPASKRDSVASYRSYDSDLTSPTSGGAGLLGINIPSGAMMVPEQESVPSLPEKLEAVPSQSGSDRAALPSSLLISQTDLEHFSSTIGTQIFATAHSQKNLKQASTEAFLELCFSRATDPRPLSGYSYGIAVLSVSIASEGKASKPIVTEIDEPRAGDIAVFFDTKFKHGLTTTKVGGSDVPHRGVVESWDVKKRKVKLLQVQGHGVEEVGYRIEDLKAGLLKIFRVVHKSCLNVE